MPTKIVSGNEVVAMVEVFCATHDIPVNAIALGGGAALMLRGMRDMTNDINLWVLPKYFNKLAEDNKVVNHPLVDVVVNPKDNEYFWVREYNPYFVTEVIDGIPCYDLLPLIVFKRGSLAEVKRPLAKRQQDREDLVLLDAALTEKNKVKEVA